MVPDDLGLVGVKGGLRATMIVNRESPLIPKLIVSG